jgi:hypothetical protein
VRNAAATTDEVRSRRRSSRRAAGLDARHDGEPARLPRGPVSPPAVDFGSPLERARRSTPSPGSRTPSHVHALRPETDPKRGARRDDR